MKEKYGVKGIKKCPKMSRQVCISGLNPIVTAGEKQKRKKSEECCPNESLGVYPSLKEEKHPLEIKHWC